MARVPGKQRPEMCKTGRALARPGMAPATSLLLCGLFPPPPFQNLLLPFLKLWTLGSLVPPISGKPAPSCVCPSLVPLPQVGEIPGGTHVLLAVLTTALPRGQSAGVRTEPSTVALRRADGAPGSEIRWKQHPLPEDAPSHHLSARPTASPEQLVTGPHRHQDKRFRPSTGVELVQPLLLGV